MTENMGHKFFVALMDDIKTKITKRYLSIENAKETLESEEGKDLVNELAEVAFSDITTRGIPASIATREVVRDYDGRIRVVLISQQKI